MTTQTRGKHIQDRLTYVNAQLVAAGKVPESTRTKAEKAVKQLAQTRKHTAETTQETKERKLSKRQKRQAQSEKAKRERDVRHKQNESLDVSAENAAFEAGRRIATDDSDEGAPAPHLTIPSRW